MPKRQYQELAEMYSPKDAQGWGNKIRMQALFRRAIIREEKPQLQNLVRSGVVGEEMLENITLADKEIELECQDVVAEAELYRDGWGQNIFQEAQSILQQQAQLQAQAAQQAAQQLQQQAKPQEQPKSASAASPPEFVDTNDSLEDLPELVSDEELRKRADQAAAELIAEEEKKKSGKGKKK
ncbi:UNVERIFIED_CONTAM: translocation protein S66 [Siphonaria sp. JEL0065]|nr:translocation protein S66 [Siphonaria sp. JEL0065]